MGILTKALLIVIGVMVVVNVILFIIHKVKGKKLDNFVNRYGSGSGKDE